MTNICHQVYIQNLNSLGYCAEKNTELRIIYDTIFTTQDRIYFLGNSYPV